MLRSRILAAAAAALLTLGMSLGGAGAAFAHHQDGHTQGGGGGGGTADSPCNFEPGFESGTKYNIPQDVASSGSMTFEWGTLSWTAQQLVFTANPGWTVDLCVKGGQQESNSILLDTGSVTIDRLQDISHFMWATPTFSAPVATAAVTTTDPNCFLGTAFSIDPAGSSNVTWGDPEISGGSISITATRTGSALFAEGLEGVSPDRTQRTFTAPYLPELPVDDPACTLPAINVTASATDLNCEPGTGSFSAGVAEGSSEHADKLLWTTTAGTVPSDVANTVNGPTTVTITVRLADDYVGGDFALNDESTLASVSTVTVDGIETALLTWTFTFSTPEDCPSLTGSTASSQCEQDAPYLSWSIDLSDTKGVVSLPTVATLTLRSTTNPAQTYTFPSVPITSAGVTTGTALWPGAAVDGDGNGTAWPGWAFVGGEWVVDDSNFGWVRGSDVELHIEVNPEVTVPVSYPDATPDCADPPVVVPEIQKVDECVQTERGDVGVASFTVTRAANLSYTYTVNGGSPLEILFPDGEDTVTIDVAPLDDVEVTAVPAPGFRIDGDPTWSWMFLESAFCLPSGPLTTAAADIVLPDCLGNPGRVILTNGLGVIWTLNGEVVAGNTTHSVPTGQAVLLTASLDGASEEYPLGFGWNDPEQQTEWKAVMEVDPTDASCALDEEDLPTLALTGVNGLTTGLGLLAVVMTVVGMGFVIRRHRMTA